MRSMHFACLRAAIACLASSLSANTSGARVDHLRTSSINKHTDKVKDLSSNSGRSVSRFIDQQDMARSITRAPLESQAVLQ